MAGEAATDDQLLAVLSNLTDLRIRGEFYTGVDTTYLDNVRLNLPRTDLCGDTLKISCSYEFSVEQYAQKTESIQLFNSGDASRSATLEIVNPHPEQLAISLPQDSVTIAPGETADVSLLIDAADAAVGVYDGILLKVIVDDGSTLYSNITVYVTEGDAILPDLTVNAGDITLTNGILTANICNRGSAPASNVQVQFSDFGELLLGGDTSIPEVPANGCTPTSITIPESPSGDRLISVVIDPSDTILELDENNNTGSRIIRGGGGSGATGHILVSGSSSMGQVCPGSLFSLAGHAVYAITVNGTTNTDYVVKGGFVGIKADWLALYGDIHTDVNGDFRRFVLAPESPGKQSVEVTVSDRTFTGTGKIRFEVLPEEDCAAGVPKPIVLPPGSDPGSADFWKLVDAITGVWEWICSGDNCPPVPEQDVFVYSENIAFIFYHPRPNDDVTIGAQIPHFATRTDLPSGKVKVTIHISAPGSSSITLPSITIDNIPAGHAATVFANWRPPTDGFYIVEVAIDPVELTENPLNNAATRAIPVGQATDPNDKVGPLGEGAERFLSGEEPLDYTVFFENLETATTPAQEVVISDHLDTATMDLSTLSLGSIAFGETIVTPPPGVRTYSTDVDLRPDKELIARVEADLDPETGLLVWRFSSIDPATGQPTIDPSAGFLPPNVNPPEGNGSVRFTVMPQKGLPTGTMICNKAEIQFDLNEPIETSQWCNKFDNDGVDTIPPTITVPPDITAEATGPTGAVVTYSVSATDDTDGEMTPSCEPASGSTFPLGERRVDCTATDAAGNSASDAFTVTVVDTTAPTIMAPSDISLVALAPLTNVSLGTPTTSDAVGVVNVTNDAPAAGFPVGATTVTWKASDAAGNSASDVQMVTIVNSRPEAEDQSVSLDEDTTIAITLTASDVDSPPQSLTYTIGSGPAHGSLSGTPPTLTYTPEANYFGSDSLTFKVSDGLDSAEATVSIEVLPVNDPPEVRVDVTTQTHQYSDEIGKVTITAEDVDDSSLALTLRYTVDGGTLIAGLPNGLSSTGGCSTETGADTTCQWEMTGFIDAQEGEYVIQAEVADAEPLTAQTTTKLNVTPENASVVFDDENPVAVQVEAPGGNSGTFDIIVRVHETQPDTPVNTAAAGDISLAKDNVSVNLVPVGPGGSVSTSCNIETEGGTGYAGILKVTCPFYDVPVNTYTVDVQVAGGYYTGSNEDVLTVFDPSLGFTTGGGWFYWPDSEDLANGYPGDKTNFGYTMKYNKNATKVQGSLLLIRHTGDGDKYRIKSNAIFGLALGEDSSVPMGWASFSGKTTYLEPGMVDPEGNHEFTAYVEDRNEPGTGMDRVWLETRDKDGVAINELSMPEPAVDKSQALKGGNIVVPHVPAGGGSQ